MSGFSMRRASPITPGPVVLAIGAANSTLLAFIYWNAIDGNWPAAGAAGEYGRYGLMALAPCAAAVAAWRAGGLSALLTVSILGALAAAVSMTWAQFDHGLVVYDGLSTETKIGVLVGGAFFAPSFALLLPLSATVLHLLRTNRELGAQSEPNDVLGLLLMLIPAAAGGVYAAYELLPWLAAHNLGFLQRYVNLILNAGVPLVLGAMAWRLAGVRAMVTVATVTALAYGTGGTIRQLDALSGFEVEAADLIAIGFAVLVSSLAEGMLIPLILAVVHLGRRSWSPRAASALGDLEAPLFTNEREPVRSNSAAVPGLRPSE